MNKSVAKASPGRGQPRRRSPRALFPAGHASTPVPACGSVSSPRPSVYTGAQAGLHNPMTATPLIDGHYAMKFFSNRFDAWLYGFAVALVLAMALIIALAPVPYFHDFGEWLYQGKILALKLTDPEAVAGFALAHYPVPNSLAPVILGLLCLTLEPILAGKVFLILLLGGWLWGSLVFAKRYGPDDAQGAVMALLVSLAALASFHWYGFVGYQLGLSVFFIFLSFYKEHRSWVWVASFGVILFLSHAMVFLAWGLLLGIKVLVDGHRVRQQIVFGLAPAAVLALWFLLGRWLTGFAVPVADAQMQHLSEVILYKFGYPLLLGGFRNLLRPDGVGLLEQDAWLYWLGVASNAMAVMALGIFVLLAFLRSGATRVRPGCLDGPSPDGSALSLRLFGLAVMGIYLVAPYNFFGLIHPGGRLLLPLLAVALILSDRKTYSWVRWAAIPALLGAMISVASYGVLQYQTAVMEGKANAAVPSSSHEAPPRQSVFAYNDWLYPNTKFKYFNYRVFAFANRFSQLQEGHFHGLGFRTGPILGYRPKP